MDSDLTILVYGVVFVGGWFLLAIVAGKLLKGL